jgi:hypothetical protein
VVAVVAAAAAGGGGGGGTVARQPVAPKRAPPARPPQVGIVALNLIGEPLAPSGGPAYLSDVAAAQAGELGYYNR